MSDDNLWTPLIEAQARAAISGVRALEQDRARNAVLAAAFAWAAAQHKGSGVRESLTGAVLLEAVERAQAAGVTP